MPDNFDAARVANDVVARLMEADGIQYDDGTFVWERGRLAPIITAALLEARKAPEGHVIDDRGVVLQDRKPPDSANDADLRSAVLELCETYQPRKPGLAAAIMRLIQARDRGHWNRTREAAEAAKEEGR